MNVTAHLMIRNEEYWIGHVLTPILQVMDHVIIADTGSTDDTVKICRQVIKEHGARCQVTLMRYGELDKSANGHVRQEMTDLTDTEWMMVIDGDEWYPPEVLRHLKDYAMPKVANLGYYSLRVVRFDESKHIFRFAEPWSGQILYRVKGLQFQGDYPDEIPNWNLDGSKQHYINAPGLPTVLDFHHLARSRHDKSTPHRMDKRGLMEMGKEVVLPFDLKRWANPYAGKVG